jgi:hypothetical protein
MQRHRAIEVRLPALTPPRQRRSALAKGGGKADGNALASAGAALEAAAVGAPVSMEGLTCPRHTRAAIQQAASDSVAAARRRIRWTMSPTIPTFLTNMAFNGR